MTVAHSDVPLRIPAPIDVDPNLQLELSANEHHGFWLPGSADEGRLQELVSAPPASGSPEPREFQARLTIQSRRRAAEVGAFADLAIREAGGEQALVVRCQSSELTLGLITLLDPDDPRFDDGHIPLPFLYWSLTPRSADATARADLLDFLREIHAGGQLQISDADTDENLGKLDVPGAPFDPVLEDDWRFLSDVATLEEWSGVPLPLPPQVSAAEVQRVCRAAEIVREREALVPVETDIPTTVSSDPATIDELQLEQDFGVEVFGREVPLGVGTAKFAVKVVGEAEPERTKGLWHVVFRPTTSGQPLAFSLCPPAGREAYKRTLATGEEPDEVSSPVLPPEWMEGEREAEEELRRGQGIRFSGENALLNWLQNPDRPPAE